MKIMSSLFQAPTGRNNRAQAARLGYKRGEITEPRRHAWVTNGVSIIPFHDARREAKTKEEVTVNRQGFTVFDVDLVAILKDVGEATV
jgi:hypothetical protein